jgi:hypothetical protein
MAKEVIAVSVETEVVIRAKEAASADSRSLSNWVELAMRKALEADKETA